LQKKKKKDSNFPKTAENKTNIQETVKEENFSAD
jgi:hypothetical protein